MCRKIAYVYIHLFSKCKVNAHAKLSFVFAHTSDRTNNNEKKKTRKKENRAKRLVLNSLS